MGVCCRINIKVSAELYVLFEIFVPDRQCSLFESICISKFRFTMERSQLSDRYLLGQVNGQKTCRETCFTIRPGALVDILFY